MKWETPRIQIFLVETFLEKKIVEYSEWKNMVEEEVNLKRVIAMRKYWRKVKAINPRKINILGKWKISGKKMKKAIGLGETVTESEYLGG